MAFSDVAINLDWGCNVTDLSNVSNVTSEPPIGLGAEIGDGFNNTNDILQDCPTASAALAARSLGAQWFLPSAKELSQMYINKTTLEGVSGFTAFSFDYWSSTEYDNDFACSGFRSSVILESPQRTTQPMCVLFGLFSYLIIYQFK